MINLKQRCLEGLNFSSNQFYLLLIIENHNVTQKVSEKEVWTPLGGFMAVLSYACHCWNIFQRLAVIWLWCKVHEKKGGPCKITKLKEVTPHTAVDPWSPCSVEEEEGGEGGREGPLPLRSALMKYSGLCWTGNRWQLIGYCTNAHKRRDGHTKDSAHMQGFQPRRCYRIVWFVQSPGCSFSSSSICGSWDQQRTKESQLLPSVSFNITHH